MPTAHQFNRLPDAPQKPQDARWAPLGELASAIARSAPRGRPTPALRAKRRFREWKANSAATLPSKAPRPETAEEAEFAQQAYEAKLAEGPDWLRYRGDSKVMDAPEVRISDELEARILKRFEKTVRARPAISGRRPGQNPDGAQGRRHLARARVFIRLAKKFGRVFPSLAGLASRAAAACAGQTAHNAKEALVALGFVTKHRRVQEVETPHGRKIVQDRNAYEIHMPPEGSLGDRILGGDLSESEIERAKASPSFSEQSFLPKAPKTAVPAAERTRVGELLHAFRASLGPQPAT